MVKTLEELGIGRPSTYAPTISTILEREYVKKEKRALVPTELGEIVTDLMKKNFPDIVDIQFTADMEEKLDTVELSLIHILPLFCCRSLLDFADRLCTAAFGAAGKSGQSDSGNICCAVRTGIFGILSGKHRNCCIANMAETN